MRFPLCPRRLAWVTRRPQGASLLLRSVLSCLAWPAWPLTCFIRPIALLTYLLLYCVLLYRPQPLLLNMLIGEVV